MTEKNNKNISSVYIRKKLAIILLTKRKGEQNENANF